MANSGLLTTIIDTYYRPALLREAVGALQRQKYENLEIILVNNGATAETVAYLHEVASLDSRIKLIHFRENQYSPDDPVKMLDTCANEALRQATGDYVFYQADDDLIADDYAEKMVALFKENPDCTTAAGLTCSIDINGNLIDEGPRRSNFRPRYMPGHELSLRLLRGDSAIFNAPGNIFTVRRDVLVEAGGFHRAFESSQLYGIVPFGVTGFDETAIFYWRRHEGQLNKLLTARGWLGIDENRAWLREWEIQRRWQVFGAEEAREVVSSLDTQLSHSAANWFIINLLEWRVAASFRIFRKVLCRKHFWSRTLLLATKRLLVSPVWRLVKPSVRRAFGLWPPGTGMPATLGRLRERANR